MITVNWARDGRLYRTMGVHVYLKVAEMLLRGERKVNVYSDECIVSFQNKPLGICWDVDSGVTTGWIVGSGAKWRATTESLLLGEGTLEACIAAVIRRQT